MGYDRKKNARQETARIEILDPKTHAPTACFVTIYGPQTVVFEEASEAMRRRTLQLIRKYRREEDIPNAARAENYRLFLADVTANIEGLEDDGKPVAYSRTEALAFYEDMDIAAQISREITDRANF